MILTMLLLACGICPEEGDEVLFLGDSLLAWNEHSCQSLGAEIALQTGRSYTNAARNGAGVLGDGAGIPEQHELDDFAQVVISGGANDLNGRCSCGSCDYVLDLVVSHDGSEGRMPDLVDAWVGQGSDVLVLGYYPGKPRALYGFDRCFDAISELDRRHEAMAEQRDGVTFFDLGDVLTPNESDGEYAFDGVHLSPRGARRLGSAVAPLIQQNDVGVW